MKIAIQGHPTRGKEVIQILESLDTKDILDHTGSNADWYYMRDDSLCSEKLIITSADETFLKQHDYKCYTLEEFEKEFPFKIGDKVIDYEGDTAVITGFAYIEEKLGYSLQYENGRGTATSRILKLYKEMKEERNITLTLDKAKEWYKKGGELKEVALQAYSEKELNPLPKSWIEFAKSTKFTFNGSLQYITGDEYLKNGCFPNKSIGESSKIWHKYVALFQLEQLRDCWRQGWEPDWLDGDKKKYAIKSWRDKTTVEITYVTHSFLSFQTYELACEFEETFKDLIEKAGDLI